MTRPGPTLERWVALALFALAVPTAPLTARAAPATPVNLEAAQAHQILVMLKLSPDHFRPGNSYGGDYGDQQTQAGRRRLAERIAHRHGLSLSGDGWPMPLVGLDCYVMTVPDGRAVDTAIADVARDPLVAWSQPVNRFDARGAPPGPADHGDPLFAVQPAARAWRLAELHRLATGRGVVVAVVDSKVEVDHPDLAGQFVADMDFVLDHPSGPERHGTGVAGVIAAKADNGLGIVGIAPRARLMALRACWQGEGGASAATVCDSLSLAKAIHFAVDHNASIINLSLAGPPDLLLRKLLEVAAARRIAVVAAYDPAMPNGGFPASEPGVIAVTIDSLPTVPVGVYAAPGKDIPTTEPGGKWDLVNGSSFAAAHVSGLIALVREAHAFAPRTLLVATQPAGGAVDACATILRPARACDCSCPSGGALARTAR